MDIREYSYILAVVDCGNISKAAEKLCMSQPSLTTYIKNLEKRLGFQFFEEGRAKNKLTQEGAVYVDYARKISALNNNLHKQLEDFRNIKRGLVRIGIGYTRSATYLPVLLPELFRRFPDIQIDIQEGTSKALEYSLSMGELDFAFLNLPFQTQQFSYIPLSEEDYVLVAPKSYQLAQKAILKPETPYPWLDMCHTADFPFVLLRPNQRVRQIADTLFLQAGVKPNIICEISSMDTAYNIIRSGMALSFTLDSHLKTVDPNIDVFSVGNPRISSQIVIAHSPSRTLSHAAKAVIQVAREVVPTV